MVTTMLSPGNWMIAWLVSQKKLKETTIPIVIQRTANGKPNVKLGIYLF